EEVTRNRFHISPCNRVIVARPNVPFWRLRPKDRSHTTKETATVRFMVFVIPGDTSYEAGAMPDESLITQMMQFNEDLANAGIMLGGEGLHPTAKGARVTFSGGKRTVTDGPFAETREVIGGYWIWQVDSKQEALDWASRCPLVEGDVLELRQVFEPSDFDIDPQSELGAQTARVAAKVEQNKAATAESPHRSA